MVLHFEWRAPQRSLLNVKNPSISHSKTIKFVQHLGMPCDLSDALTVSAASFSQSCGKLPALLSKDDSNSTYFTGNAGCFLATVPAVLLNLLQIPEQPVTALGRRLCCRCLGRRLRCGALRRARCVHVRKRHIPVVQVGAVWPYTQLIHLPPASEADCRSQIFPTCWRSDRQRSPVVLVMGELPGEVRGCALRTRAPRSSPSYLGFASPPRGG